jgi:hypothetical protein
MTKSVIEKTESPFEIMKLMLQGRAPPQMINGNETIIYYGLGFSDPGVASAIGKYLYMINPKIMDRLLMVSFFHKKFPRWIKKPKVEHDAVIEAYCKEHGIEKSPILIKLIDDHPREFLTEIRAPKDEFDKRGIELDMPEKSEWW